MKIKFESEEHKNFFFRNLQESTIKDTYHQALFYTFGIDQSCRENFDDVFNMQDHRIKPEGLHQGWQTSGSECATKLAFNLWNGFVEGEHEKGSTPYDVFACGHAPYFFEAIKLRYPECCKECSAKSNER